MHVLIIHSIVNASPWFDVVGVNYFTHPHGWESVESRTGFI